MRSLTMTILLAGTMSLLAVRPAVAQTAGPTSAVIAGDSAEIQTLAGQLADPSRASKTKLEAAEILLSRQSPQANEALKGFLLRGDNRAAQIAVAEAIASCQVERQEFIEPLLTVLKGPDPLARPAAARALARYRNFGVLDRLLAIAQDRSADPLVRANVIVALRTVLDKKVVDALVSLLEEPDPVVTAAAAESLAALTNIRAFGADSLQWKLWWDANKDKDRWVWLNELAEGLARTKSALEADNALLRDRLARAMSDLYDATPTGQRDALVMTFLGDPLSDIRLAGLRLLDRRLAANETVTSEMRLSARALLADTDARVRQEAALLTAALGDKETLAALLDRLAAEDAPLVRRALLKALGQLHQAEALPAVLVEVRSRHDDVAAAAADALARIASRNAMEGQRRSAAVEALVERYRQAAGGGVELREALLAAMGVVGDETFAPVLGEAMKDPSAKIRLAAVTALGRVGDGGSAKLLVERTGDSDRGVRQAALAALGSLGGKEQLSSVLRCAQPEAENDATVRQHAWEAAVAILARCDDATVSAVADSLVDGAEAAEARVKILEMLSERFRKDASPRLPAVQRKLAEALVKAGRAGEAAALLGQTHAVFAAAESPEAPAVWMEWFDALLAADDPNSVAILATQTDPEVFTKAVARLLARLDQLVSTERYAAVVLLGSEAMEHLAGRLSDSHLSALRRAVENGKARQLDTDRLRADRLIPQLCSPDEAARKAAGDELQAMSDRAVLPLLMELRNAITADRPDVAAEKAIMEILRRIAPKMTGYDPSAALAQRLSLVDSWIRDFQNRSP